MIITVQICIQLERLLGTSKDQDFAKSFGPKPIQIRNTGGTDTVENTFNPKFKGEENSQIAREILIASGK